MKRSADRFLLAALLLAIASALPGCTSTTTGPISPAVERVFAAGQPPRHVPRTMSNEYPALPSPSVRIRMASAYPGGSGSMRITLDGTDASFVDLTNVARMQDCATQGIPCFGLDVRASSYDIVVLLPPSKRAGPKSTVTIRNLAGQQESAPVAVVAVTPAGKIFPEASDVFVRGGSDAPELNCKPIEGVYFRDFVIAGWLLDPPSFNEKIGSSPNELGDGEDFHWVISPDIDFFEAAYGAGGYDQRLVGTTLPGARILNRVGVPAEVSGTISLNSILLPLNWSQHSVVAPEAQNIAALSLELNGWHVHDHHQVSREIRGLRPTHWIGRGTPPWTGAVQQGTLDCFWPWEPASPVGVVDGSGHPRTLARGDYVIFKGTLFEDFAHGDADGGAGEWDLPGMVGHGGWMEVHPVDWLDVQQLPKRAKRVVGLVSVLDPAASSVDTTATVNWPSFGQPPASGQHLKFREEVDPRFTAGNPTSVVTVDETIPGINVHVTMQDSPGVKAHFKAMYVLWWE